MTTVVNHHVDLTTMVTVQTENAKNVTDTVNHALEDQTPNVMVVTYGNISMVILVEQAVLVELINHGGIENVMLVMPHVILVMEVDQIVVHLAKLEDSNMETDV